VRLASSSEKQAARLTREALSGRQPVALGDGQRVLAVMRWPSG
jgi:hypothetical protein